MKCIAQEQYKVARNAVLERGPVVAEHSDNNTRRFRPLLLTVYNNYIE